MTDAEKLLWQCLRGKQLGGYRFRRQHPIERYVLDFYCCEAKLAVELDGGQHNEEDARVRDNERTAQLEQLGIQVIRFWNSEIFTNLEGVLESVYIELQQRTSTISPLPTSPLLGEEIDSTESRKNALPQRGRAGEGEKFLTATFTETSQLERLEEALAAIGFMMPVAALNPEGWTLERPNVLALMAKMRKAGKPLGEYVEGKFYRGVLTGLNEAFVIDEAIRSRLVEEDPRNADIIKPWLRGRDIRKWEAQWSGLYIIFTRRGTDIDQYPAIKRYLEQFRVDLVPKITGKEEHGRKPGPYKWFEIQDNIAYFEEFETSKIVYPDIAQSPKFLWDDSNSYLGNTAYFIPTDEMWLVGLLNSKVLWWFYGTITSFIRGGFVRYFSQYLGQLPIPIAADSQRTPIIERVQQILADPASPDVPRLEAEIDRLVYELYGLTEEEIALVEGKA